MAHRNKKGEKIFRPDQKLTQKRQGRAFESFLRLQKETVLIMSTTTSPTLLGQEREFFDPALIALAVINLLSAFLTVCFLDEPFKWKKQPHDIVQFLLASLVAGAVSYGLTIELYGSVASTLLLFVSMCIFRLILPRLTAQANMKMICSLALAPMLLPWGYLWFEEIGMPDFIFIMYYVGAALSILLFPVGVFMVLPDAAMFTHKKFRRPHEPLPPRRSGLKVSLHLCCYAEPPDMVIEVCELFVEWESCRRLGSRTPTDSSSVAILVPLFTTESASAHQDGLREL